MTEKVWVNEHDKYKYLVDVHMDFVKYLGPDFKMCYLTPQDREFILTMLQAGIMIYQLTPNKQIAESIFLLDMIPVNTTAITKFNQKDNPVLLRYTAGGDEESVDQEEEKWQQRLLKRIKGESKPRVMEDDD